MRSKACGRGRRSSLSGVGNNWRSEFGRAAGFELREFTVKKLLSNGAWGERGGSVAFAIGVTTFGILALELALIRWTSSQIRVFAYFNNIVLICAFLGLGLGAALGRRYPGLLHLALPTLLVLAMPLAFAEPLGLVPGTEHQPVGRAADVGEFGAVCGEHRNLRRAARLGGGGVRLLRRTARIFIREAGDVAGVSGGFGGFIARGRGVHRAFPV